MASYISRPLLTLGLNLTLQSGVKYILTQGDAILITSLTTLHDQGTYALASNYGGLLARLLFQPIEEASRNLFAKLCAAAPDSNPPHTPTPIITPAAFVEEKRPQSSSSTTTTTTTTATAPPTNTNLTQAATTLLTILHLYTLLTLTILALGPPLAPSLLTLLAGSRWSSTAAGPLLATYSYYIPLLALNGVTEAFVSASASPAQLRTQSLLMGLNFVAFAGAAWLFLGGGGSSGSGSSSSSISGWGMMKGAEGLVWANCVNMLGRLVFNVRFIGRFFGARGVGFGWAACLPEWGSVAVAVCAAGVIRTQETPSPPPESGVLLLPSTALARGAAVAVVYAVLVGLFERRFLVLCWRLTRPGVVVVVVVDKHGEEMIVGEKKEKKSQ